MKGSVRVNSLLSFILYVTIVAARTRRHSTASANGTTPNFVIIVGDDVGAGDLSSYGHPSQEWGPVDTMAQEGIRFTQCYSAAMFCTPSRAALLTALSASIHGQLFQDIEGKLAEFSYGLVITGQGRLPLRSGMTGVHIPALLQNNPRGLPQSEITLAESLEGSGYVTGIVGKWHLGINAYSHEDGSHLPHTHGFDFTGTLLPFTLTWFCDTDKRHLHLPRRDSCFLYRNRTIIEQPIQLNHLTQKIVDDARYFISEAHQKKKPFFLYYSLPQTHTPMFNMEQFRNKSRRGIYGDQVNEMSWAAGEVLKTLKELSIDNETLTVFLSDHGPHREVAEEGGSAGFFRGGKGYFTEGAFRVPLVVRWPGLVKAGQVSSEVISLMDIFPTFLKLAKIPLPNDRHIDGRDISDIILAKNTQRNDRLLYFYCASTLAAVRLGPYKVYFYDIPFPNLQKLAHGHFPRDNYVSDSCDTSKLLKKSPPEIYNVEADPHEDYPLPVSVHGQLLQNIEEKLAEHRQTLGELPEHVFVAEGSTTRVIPCCNYPYCICG